MSPELTELLYAYRLAKRAFYYERRGAGLAEFAFYEKDLHSNLLRLRALLDNDAWFDNLKLGKIWAMPKSAAQAVSSDAPIVRVGRGQNDEVPPQPLDIRLMLIPSVDFAICEIMYLRTFGSMLDSAMPMSCVGNRLEVRAEAHPRIFEHWQKAYQRFRTEPLDVALTFLRSEGANGCIVASADITSFFDNIDSSFLLSAGLLAEASIPLDMQPSYLAATRSLIRVHHRYREAISAILGIRVTRGIPIGPLTSRVVANAALLSLDRFILRNADVLCYRRYVDDIIIVARRQPDARATDSAHDILSRLMPLEPNSGDAKIRLDHVSLDRSGSTFSFQSQKLKIYDLRGDEGVDFVSAVLSDVTSIASENRRLWDDDIGASGKLARLARTKERLDGHRVLRDSDRIKIANFELASTLSSLRRAAVLLGREEARSTVAMALRPVLAMLEDPMQWAVRTELFVAALQIALLAHDWDTARTLLLHTDNAWKSANDLRSRVSVVRWCERVATTTRPFDLLRDYLHRRRLEAVLGSIDPNSIPDDFSVFYGNRTVDAQRLCNFAQLFVDADLRVLDHEDDHVKTGATTSLVHAAMRQALAGDEPIARMDAIAAFLDWRYRQDDPAWGRCPVGLFLCTRPPSYYDVARRFLSPEQSLAIDTYTTIRETVNACRGTSYRADVGGIVRDATAGGPDVFLDVEAKEASHTRVILGGVDLPDSYFFANLGGAPELTLRRLSDLSTVLKDAERVALLPPRRPTIVVLPELSIPRSWLRALATYVGWGRHYSLICGVEYLHQGVTVLHNEAVGLFLGKFHSVATQTWTKRHPADLERTLIHPRVFPKPSTSRRVTIESSYGRLTVLICSELIEPHLAAELIGRAELVVSPLWNPDTETYDHLVRSVCVQTHSYIALSNNGHYSDSRIAGPYAERWRRDVCRIVQRGANSISWADLPLPELRRFHERGDGPPDSPAPVAEKSAKSKTWFPLPPALRAKAD